MLDSSQIAYNGQVVFQSNLALGPEVRHERAAEPVLLGYPHGPKTSEFVPAGRKAVSRTSQLPGPIDGTITLSADSWPVSTSTKNLSSQFGGATSTDCNAVYDRQLDILIQFNGDQVSITPTSAGNFRVQANGQNVTLYEHYYRDHQGYFFWDKPQKLWTKPVMGWCSWMAHLQDVNEGHMLAASHFFSKNLKAYGYNIVQMDDGYQRVPQNDASGYKTTEKVADLWNKPNNKFPLGLDGLASEIRKDGMTPGIWVGLYLPIGPGIKGYVTDPNGAPYRGPWVNYAINGFDQKALDSAYLDTFRGLKEKGWQYIKIDTLRHIIYDSYRKVPEYWKSLHQSPEEAFRRILAQAKKVWGSDIYVLACWGAIPELAGIPDGCRVGEDVGPDAASMRRSAKYIAQFHSLNNVIWHNDPDYMCLRIGPEMSRTWASLLALTGCQTMVSDPIDTYDADRVDTLRRVGPTAFVRPQNVAPLPPDPELIVFHGKKGNESWTVAGRFGFIGDIPERRISLSEVGLDNSKTYLAFDFWNSHFLGVGKGQFGFKALQNGTTEVVSFRELQTHPQVLGTDRHILQGAVELNKITWKNNTLSGQMQRGPGRPWSLYIHVPSGYEPILTTGMTQDGSILKLTFPESESAIEWKVKFIKR